MSTHSAALEDKIQKQKDLDDFILNIQEHLRECNEEPNKLDELTDDQVLALHKFKNPYGTTISGSSEKFTCLSYTNLREKYIEKEIITAFVGYEYRACDEHEVDDEDLKCVIDNEMFKEEITNPDSLDEEYVNIKQNELYIKVKSEYIRTYCKDIENFETIINDINLIKQYELSLDDELLINKTVSEQLEELFKPNIVLNVEKLNAYKHEECKKQAIEEQKVIKKFLNNLFEYNPDVHVRSSHNSKEAKLDKGRKELKPSSDKDNTSSMDELTLLETKIPPKDTYNRFNLYKEINYEVIRECVKNIYGLYPDLEIAFNIFDQFNSVDEANAYIEKYKNKVITDIKVVSNNKWTFAGPFKQNRERMSFYNDNTSILENMMKQMQDDAKIGGALVKDKVIKKKIKSVKEVGPDHPNFLQYKAEHATQLTLDGIGKEVDENAPIRIVEEIEVNAETGELVDEDGCPKDALEIDIFHVNAADGSMTTSKMYTKSHAPGEND